MTERLTGSERGTGFYILIIASAAGLVLSVFNYFWPHNGIHGSAGALVVAVSSLLMLLAAGALLFSDGMSRGLRGMLVFLILLDILGTGLAAYMLETYWLIVAMAAALAGSIMRHAADRAPESLSQRGAV